MKKILDYGMIWSNKILDKFNRQTVTIDSCLSQKKYCTLNQDSIEYVYMNIVNLMWGHYIFPPEMFRIKKMYI